MYQDKGVCAVRVIQRPGNGTCHWLKAYSRKGQKWSSSLVCTSPVNVRTEGFYSCKTSNLHAELNQLTGVAAILTFPLDIEVVEAEEKEAAEEAERKRLEEEGAVG